MHFPTTAHKRTYEHNDTNSYFIILLYNHLLWVVYMTYSSHYGWQMQSPKFCVIEIAYLSCYFYDALTLSSCFQIAITMKRHTDHTIVLKILKSKNHQLIMKRNKHVKICQCTVTSVILALFLYANI